MATITILRAFWHRRLLVVGVCLLSVLAGTAVTFGTSRHQVSLATARILVNTPSSQIVNVAPKGTDQLGGQALLLAGLMVNGPIKSEIARDAGLQPNQIVGLSPSITAASPASAAPVSSSGGNSYMLTTQVLTDAAGDNLPIIEVDVQAPTSAGAVRLANAAVTGVRNYEASVASSEQIANNARLQLNGLSTPQATTEIQGTSRILAVVAAVVVFLLGCFCILLFPALARDWRALSESELFERDEPLIGQFGALPPAGTFDRPRSPPRGPLSDLPGDDQGMDDGEAVTSDLSKRLAGEGAGRLADRG